MKQLSRKYEKVASARPQYKWECQVCLLFTEEEERLREECDESTKYIMSYAFIKKLMDGTKLQQCKIKCSPFKHRWQFERVHADETISFLENIEKGFILTQTLLALK